jgi:hypothetical protein
LFCFHVFIHILHKIHDNSPSIKHQRNVEDDTSTRLGDFRRSKNGICSGLDKCKFLDKKNPIKTEVEWKKKYYDVTQDLHLYKKTEEVSEEEPTMMKKKNIVLIICIIIFLIALYVILKNKLSQYTAV